jgi:hypothetical protein
MGMMGMFSFFPLLLYKHKAHMNPMYVHITKINEMLKTS